LAVTRRNALSLAERALLVTARELLAWGRARPCKRGIARAAVGQIPRVLRLIEDLELAKLAALVEMHRAGVAAMASDVGYSRMRIREYLHAAPELRP
jgi:hypothetical protein